MAVVIKYMRLFTLLLIIVSLFMLTSCATILETAVEMVLNANTCSYPGCTNVSEDGSVYCSFHSKTIHHH